MPASPGDLRLSADCEQEIELLGEQLVVVVEIVAEQRKGLDERAAPGHDLGAAFRDEIEGRELLIDAHRIVRRQHGDGAREPNALRPRGGGGERHGGRGDRIVRPMVLAEPEHIETDAVGQLDLLDDVGESLVDIDRLARDRIAPGLDKGVGAELHEWPRSMRASHGAQPEC